MQRRQAIVRQSAISGLRAALLASSEAGRRDLDRLIAAPFEVLAGWSSEEIEAAARDFEAALANPDLTTAIADGGAGDRARAVCRETPSSMVQVLRRHAPAAWADLCRAGMAPPLVPALDALEFLRSASLFVPGESLAPPKNPVPKSLATLHGKLRLEVGWSFIAPLVDRGGHAVGAVALNGEIGAADAAPADPATAFMLVAGTAWQCDLDVAPPTEAALARIEDLVIRDGRPRTRTEHGLIPWLDGAPAIIARFRASLRDGFGRTPDMIGASLREVDAASTVLEQRRQRLATEIAALKQERWVQSAHRPQLDWATGMPMVPPAVRDEIAQQADAEARAKITAAPALVAARSAAERLREDLELLFEHLLVSFRLVLFERRDAAWAALAPRDAVALVRVGNIGETRGLALREVAPLAISHATTDTSVITAQVQDLQPQRAQRGRPRGAGSRTEQDIPFLVEAARLFRDGKCAWSPAVELVVDQHGARIQGASKNAKITRLRKRVPAHLLHLLRVADADLESAVRQAISARQ